MSTDIGPGLMFLLEFSGGFHHTDMLDQSFESCWGFDVGYVPKLQGDMQAFNAARGPQEIFEIIRTSEQIACVMDTRVLAF